MNTHVTPLRCVAIIFPLLAALALGCDRDGTERQPDAVKKETGKAVEVKKVPAGKNVWVEVEDKKVKRVGVQAEVCLQKGQLEQLMCRKHTKEHEAILAADADARDIHKALIAAGAEPGAPVQFDPKYVPARGQTIKVMLRYEEKGKTVTVPARSWVRNAKDGKELNVDWVFAGSRFIKNPLDPDKPPLYLANDGDVICVSNFDTAMLDLPIASPKDNSDLIFEAFSERVPPVGTKVTVLLEPVADAKKKKR
jgi:hypothetical protein